jgi:hypothetical protein
LERRCPLCHAKLIEQKEPRYAFLRDFTCNRRDHFFGKRVATNDGAVVVVKIRLRDGWGGRLSLKLYYSQGFSEVWRGNDRQARVTVPLLVNVDLSNPASIRRAVERWLCRGVRLRWSLRGR